MLQRRNGGRQHEHLPARQQSHGLPKAAEVSATRWPGNFVFFFFFVQSFVEHTPCVTGIRRRRRTAAEPLLWTAPIPNLLHVGPPHERL